MMTKQYTYTCNIGVGLWWIAILAIRPIAAMEDVINSAHTQRNIGLLVRPQSYGITGMSMDLYQAQGHAHHV